MTIEAIAHQAAKGIRCDPAAIWALARVESGGGKHLHRYEPHVFKRLTGRSARSYAAAHRDNPEAAAKASSHGVFHVMGRYYQDLGYDTALDMAKALSNANDVSAQANSVIKYCTVTSPASGSALRSLDAEELARAYNGSQGVARGYHIKFRKALAAAGRHSAVTLSMGDTGDSVAVLQDRLYQLGHDLVVDGHFGRKTEAAVMRVQRKHGLKVDGVVGNVTWTAIGGQKSEAATTPIPGLAENAEVVIAENPVKTVGAVLGAGGLALNTAFEWVQNFAAQYGIGVSDLQPAVAVAAPYWTEIKIGAALLAIAGCGWIIWRDYRNGKREQDEWRAVDAYRRADGVDNGHVPEPVVGDDAAWPVDHDTRPDGGGFDLGKGDGSGGDDGGRHVARRPVVGRAAPVDTGSGPALFRIGTGASPASDTGAD